MNILIVGGGPAGLATANFLDSSKHTVTIIEKEKKFSTMGYGIFFFHQGKQLLRQATHDSGIHQFLKQIGFKRYVNEQGKKLSDIHYNKIFHVHDSDSITSIKRADLHRLLRTHLPKKVRLKMGTTIASIENAQDSAHVRFSDGTDATFDLVISAEGSHSLLREQFFSYRIKTLPWVARYFWLDKTIPRFLIEWGAHATVMCMPHKNKTTMLSIENADVFASSNRQHTVPGSLVAFYRSLGLSESAMRKCYAQSHPTSMRYVYTNKWFCNRVVLIGDAQHAMTPTLGFGTSLALDDAYQLATMLNTMHRTQTMHDVLTRFSRNRNRKIGVLRSINRFMDFLLYRKSTRYYHFWYAHRFIGRKVCEMLDGLIRLGWKYS